MNKLGESKMKSHPSTFNSIGHHKNNVYPLKPEFRKYINTNIVKRNTAKDKSESTAKSVLISMIVISIWCFAMVMLAKASHQFLREISLQTVKQINLNRK